MAPTAWQLAAISALGYFTTVTGHGFMCGPDPEFTTSGDKTAFIATIPSTVFPSFGPNEDAAKNAEKFAQGMTEGGFPNLKTFLQPYGSECGDTNKNTSPRQIPTNGKMCWKNSDTEGLTASHHGPCEIWIDDQMIVNSDDCVKKFGSQSPTLFDVDYSKCTGTCNLQFYWVALQSADSAGFQVYKNCVPLAGSPVSGNGGGATDAPAPSTETPAPIADIPDFKTFAPIPNIPDIPDIAAPVADTPVEQMPAPIKDIPGAVANLPAPGVDTPVPDAVANLPVPGVDTPVPVEQMPAPIKDIPVDNSLSPLPNSGGFPVPLPTGFPVDDMPVIDTPAPTTRPARRRHRRRHRRHHKRTSNL